MVCSAFSSITGFQAAEYGQELSREDSAPPGTDESAWQERVRVRAVGDDKACASEDG